MPIDLLVGRTVVAGNGQSVGRIHEFRVDVRGKDWVVTEVVLGVGGLLERLNVGIKLIVGGKVGRKIATVDQIDITDPKHPLTARVIVNRLWQYHFGRGIVATPNNFGSLGEKPTSSVSSR